ncbi:MAG: dicarboxylate/amino acid:cation symporter [Chthonomonas sp.]|nr:dicarboxylate/amino acid:cation symporter [Chthonomonas sp.]
MSSSERRGMAMHTKVLLGLLLGAICGAIAQQMAWPFLEGLVTNVMKPIGAIFLNLIFMIVVPLLFSALVLGVSELGDAAKIGRVGMKCLAFTILFSGIAVAIGVGMVNTFKPGSGFTPEQVQKLETTIGKKADATKSVEKSKEVKSAADTIVELIPRNPLEQAVKALDGGLLPFMVFALIFGIALAGVEPERAAPVKAFLDGLFAVSLRIIDMAMKLAPIGVFALVFSVAATLGPEAFIALGKYVVVVMVALLIHQFVVYSVMLRVFAKRNPWQFFRQIRSVMLTAFSTSSSNATLPTALKVAEEEVGLPPTISRFVLTVGATANQNGTALFEGITILFLAQMFGVSLDLGQQLTVMGLAILAGVGTAGVPGGAWPMIALILVKIGVPAEAIGICLGVDRILDMSRTVLNVTGDIAIAACVAGSERELPAPIEA